MGDNKTCWGFVSSESNTKSTLRRSVPAKGRHAVDPEPATPPCRSHLRSSDLLVCDFDRGLASPEGVHCTPPPNPTPVLRKSDPEMDPEPPDTVEEENTELASLHPEEAEMIRLDVRCKFGWLSGC